MIMNWIVGLNIIELPLGKPRPAFTVIYVFLIHSVYWCITFYDTTTNLKGDINSLGKNIFSFLKYTNTFIATTSSIIGWYYSKVCF